ncbi:MAG: hypothetical protein O8C64_07810 [Candidatus Methanoperedens sp.]|nr:hypothetical protein [Candidatus Methanoperedens sp.]
MRQNKIQKTTYELIDYAYLVIVAMVLIFVVYKFAEVLVGQIPATIGSIILGLAGVFIFVTNKKIRQEILNWGK